MPEAPEVRRLADRVADVVVDRPLLRVRFGPEHLQRFEAPLQASRVRAIDTHGKAMLTRFACGLTVMSHLYAFGRWKIVPAGEVPDTPRRLRFGMYTHERDALLYSAMLVEVVPDEAVHAIPYMVDLGPDCLTARLDAVVAHIDAPRFERRRLSAVLLDQAFIAGIGNYLRCEVMFAVGLHPRMRYGETTPAHRRAIAAAALELSRRSYADEGLDFKVFARNRKPCKVCGARIVREKLDGRPCSWCPRCQPAP